MQKKFVLIPLILIAILFGITHNNFNKNENIMKKSQISQALGLKTSVMPSNLQPAGLHNKTTFKGNIGVVIDDYANKNRTLTALEQKLGKTISTISFFKQFGGRDNRISFSKLEYAKKNSLRLLIAWEPWSADEKDKQIKDYLKEISEGKQDEYIRVFAGDISKLGLHTTIRFGHEMNGDWYPWGKRPDEYKRAYRHIHNIFREEKAANVRFMWSVNISENPAELNDYYPGDDAVDIIGIDGFNFGTTQDYGGWRSFSSLFGPTYRYLESKYGKPISIAETASTEHGGSKAAWISEMFRALASDYPDIDEIIWFNIIKETDWRIESSKSSLKAFVNNI